MHLSQSCVRFWYMSHFVGTATAICRSHDRLLLEITPRYLCDSTSLRLTLLNIHVSQGWKGLLILLEMPYIQFDLVKQFSNQSLFFFQNRCLAEINGFQQLYLHVLVDIIIVCKTLIFKLHHTLFNLYRLRFSSEH